MMELLKRQLQNDTHRSYLQYELLGYQKSLLVITQYMYQKFEKKEKYHQMHLFAEDMIVLWVYTTGKASARYAKHLFLKKGAFNKAIVY